MGLYLLSVYLDLNTLTYVRIELAIFPTLASANYRALSSWIFLTTQCKAKCLVFHSCHCYA